jgi:hypothetical protein
MRIAGEGRGPGSTHNVEKAAAPPRMLRNWAPVFAGDA